MKLCNSYDLQCIYNSKVMITFWATTLNRERVVSNLIDNLECGRGSLLKVENIMRRYK